MEVMYVAGLSDNFGRNLIWNKGYFGKPALEIEFELCTEAEWVSTF